MAEQKNEKKRRGRPPLEGERKTRTVPFRCEERMYRWLVQSAKQNGRTMSQEIAIRVDRSFRYPTPDIQLVQSIAQSIINMAPPSIDVELIKGVAENWVGRMPPLYFGPPTTGGQPK